MIYAKGKNQIMVNPINGAVGYPVAILKLFNIVDNSYSIEYGYVYDNNGENCYARLGRPNRSRFEEAEVDAMFQAAGGSSGIIESFTTEIKVILNQALIFKLAMDNRFQIPAEDWEIVEDILA